jgi:hypothetical protein
MARRWWAFALLASVLATGCAEVANEPAGRLAGARSDAELTNVRPEVGRIRTDAGWCTATSIAPQVVLTAAHCGRFQTGDGPFSTGPWVFQSGKEEIEVDRFVSFGKEIGPLDLAIAHLTRAASAAPAKLATGDPAAGDVLTFIGIDCTTTFPAGSEATCAGNDGGATFLANADLYSVTSAHRPGRDELAFPARVSDAIAATISAWTAPTPTAPPSVPTPALKKPCEEDGLRVCTAWVLEAWDSEACTSGYTRRRKCNEMYDCRTSDHNDTCTSLYPGGPKLARCGTCP